MKKTLFAAFLALMTFGLIGCESGVKKGLSKPTGLRVHQDGETLVLKWNAVKKADEYVLSRNGYYWQITSVTTATDYEPEEGNNTYEIVAVNDNAESEPATISYYYQTSGGGGGGGEETTSYYIKHPWGSGSDSSWEWKKMTKSGNSYTYTGEWGGVGANINTVADDSGAEWYEKSKINGASSLSVGEEVTFTFTPTSGNVGSLSVSSNGGGGGGQTVTLSAPTGFSLTQTTSSIKLSWNRVSGAAGYAVYKALPTDERYSYLDATSSTSYIDTDVESGETYYYAVAAYDDDYNVGESAQDYITFNGSGGGSTTSKPNAPGNVSASATSTCIEVSWSSVNGADSYNVYRATSASGTYSYKGNTSSTYYSDCSVTAGTTYYYKVTAENSDGESEKSAYASAKVASGGGGTTNYEPCPPTNVKCSGSTTISISWNAATGSGCGTPTSYTVYRFDGTPNASPAWVSIASNITSKSYTDTAPHPGENKYIVTAKNSEGTSANSYPATSSNIKLKAPVVKSVYGSQMGLDVTIENFIKDIPDEYLDAYYIEVFMSTTSSFSSAPTFTSKITDALYYNKYSDNLIYEYDWSVSHGSTYKYKVRLQFSASNNIVYSDYSSVYTVTH